MVITGAQAVIVKLRPFGEADSTNSKIEESISETTSNDNWFSYPESNEILLTQTGECGGEADCVNGTVTEIVDGDTIDVDNVRIRLTMVNTPERGELGYSEATGLIESICPVGSHALANEDDGQKGGELW